MEGAPRWETDTEIGRRLVSEFDSYSSIFLVIKNRRFFDEIRALNNGSNSCDCRWLQIGTEDDNASAKWDGDGDGDDSDTDSAPSTATAEGRLRLDRQFVAVALSAPSYLHEKAKCKLPDCFIFGRKARPQRADAWLGPSSRSAVSRNHFAIGLAKGRFWVIRALVGRLTVNGLPFDDTSATLALLPDDPNALEVEGDEIEVYCREPRIVLSSASRGLDLEMPNAERSFMPSITTVFAPPDVSVPGYRPQKWYVSDRGAPPSRTEDTNYLVMDPWTCRQYVGKYYPLTSRDLLASRLQMLARLPATAFCRSPTLSFIRQELLAEEGNALFLLTSLQEDTYPLIDHHEDVKFFRRQDMIASALQEMPVIRTARRLLFSLIRLVTRAHSFGIVHGDICLHTIFAYPDPARLEEVSLGGWPEASEDMTLANRDYHQIFQSVRDYLGALVDDLPPHWLGHQDSNALWSRLDDPLAAWPFDPRELAARLGLNSDRSDELWTTITLKKQFDFELTRKDGTVHLDSRAVERYVVHDAIFTAGYEATGPDIARRCQMALKALAATDATISAGRFRSFHEHMDKRHAAPVGWGLNWAVPWNGGREGTVTCSSRLGVPYHAGYGLVNVWLLRYLAPQVLREELFKPLLGQCLELWGSPPLGGVYLPVTHLARIAEAMQLYLDEGHVGVDENTSLDEAGIGGQRDASLDEFTHGKWYLVAPNESSGLFPVNRATGEVRLLGKEQGEPPITLPLGEFIKTRFQRGSYLDSHTAYDACALTRDLDPPEALLDMLHSCDGSVGSSSDRGFRFGTRRTGEAGEAARKPLKRVRAVEDWLEEEGSRRRRADIQPTKFVAGGADRKQKVSG